jgi:hypothetical protein
MAPASASLTRTETPARALSSVGRGIALASALLTRNRKRPIFFNGSGASLRHQLRLLEEESRAVVFLHARPVISSPTNESPLTDLACA